MKKMNNEEGGKFSIIGSILVSIITILTSIVTILASIEQVNTPLAPAGGTLLAVNTLS